MPDPVAPKRFDDDSPNIDFSQAATTGSRIVAQALGVLLILFGIYFGIQIASDVLGAMRKPAALEGTLGDMSKALGLADAEIPLAPKPLAIGRLASGIILLVGYFIAMVIAMRLVVNGGRLVLGISAERRAFYDAVREFSTAVRIEQQR